MCRARYTPSYDRCLFVNFPITKLKVKKSRRHLSSRGYTEAKFSIARILGEKGDPICNFFLILSQFSTKIKIRTFDIKFDQNQIMKILQIWGGGRGRERVLFVKIVNLVLIFNQHSNKDFSYKISSKSDDVRRF